MRPGPAWLAILAACCLAVVSVGFPRGACATDAPDAGDSPMTLLKAEAEKLGTPRLEDVDREVPTLYFGTTKMNGNFALLDEVARRSGMPHTTIGIYVRGHGPDPGSVSPEFISAAIRHGEYARESGAVWVWARPWGYANSPSMGDVTAAIRADRPYYGVVDSGGTTFQVESEPIHDAANSVIGFYFVADGVALR
jgi:hypothetical protein